MEVKSILRKMEDEFPQNDAYKTLKKEVLRIFGPKPEAGMDRALNRVLTGKPSQLARALVDDMCKADFNCQCCPSNVLAMWKKQLPTQVRAGIAHCAFTKDTFNKVVELADDIFDDTQGSARVAAVAAVKTPVSLDETQPAIPYPEVAAIRGRGRGRGRGNRGGRGGRGGQGGQASQPQQGSRRGPKHPDLPPGDFKWCGMHHKWGKNSYFCADPTNCPWKDITAPRPDKQ